MATSWTQADLVKLEEAIRTGARRVAYADRSVDYRSLDDMVRTKNLIEAELGQSSAPARKVMATSKGFRTGGSNTGEFLP